MYARAGAAVTGLAQLACDPGAYSQGCCLLQAAVLWLLHRRRKVRMVGTAEHFFSAGPGLIEWGAALRAGVPGGPMHEGPHWRRSVRSVALFRDLTRSGVLVCVYLLQGEC